MLPLAEMNIMFFFLFFFFLCCFSRESISLLDRCVFFQGSSSNGRVGTPPFDNMALVHCAWCFGAFCIARISFPRVGFHWLKGIFYYFPLLVFRESISLLDRFVFFQKSSSNRQIWVPSLSLTWLWCIVLGALVHFA